MVTRDEAVAVAQRWLAGSPLTPAGVEIDVYEFDLGYVVGPRRAPVPAELDPALGLPDLGGSVLVVDRETGEVDQFPLMPPEVVAEQYRVAKAARARFSPLVYADLSAAYWSPGRDVSAAVDAWLARTGVERELPMFPAARRAMAEFGGLTLGQRGPTGEPGKGYASTIYPAANQPMTQDVADFGQVLGTAVFPLGDHEDGPALLAIDERGRVFLLHPVEWVFLGETMDEAVGWMTQGGPRPVLDDNARW